MNNTHRLFSLIKRTLHTDGIGLFITFIFFIFSILPLFHAGLFPTYDNVSVIRIDEMVKELQNGQFPVRMLSDLARGRGYMLFNFYGPFPFYIASILHIVGINLVGALKRTFFIACIVAFIGMYKLAREFFGPKGAAIAVVLFILSPYYGYDMYIRGGLGSFWALAVLPWILWSTYRNTISKNGNYFLITAFGIAILICSHNLTAYLSFPFLMLWIIYWLKKNKGSLILSAASITAGLLLSLFYWLPLVVEKNNIWVGQLQHPTETLYEQHMIGTIESIITPYFPAKFHWVYLVVPLGIMTYALANKKKIWSKHPVLSISLSLYILSFMLTTKITYPLWQTFFPLLYIVQFPWRLLGLTIVFASLIGGTLSALVPKKIALIIPIIIGLMLIAISGKNFQPERYEFVDTYRVDDPCGVTWQITEYLPTSVRYCLKQDSKSPATIVFGDAESSVKTTTPKGITIEVLGEPSIVQFDRYFYPGWTATLDGKPVQINAYSNRYGLIQMAAPAGQHVMSITYRQTVLQQICNFISITTLLSMILYCIFRLRPSIRP